MAVTIISTLTNGRVFSFATYAEHPLPGAKTMPLPSSVRYVHIHGGANLGNYHGLGHAIDQGRNSALTVPIYLPEGVATVVTDEDFELLAADQQFTELCQAGFFQVQPGDHVSGKGNEALADFVSQAVRDMEARDNHAPESHEALQAGAEREMDSELPPTSPRAERARVRGKKAISG